MSIDKIPGPLLIALGGLFLSSGGTIFRSFEMTDPWTIYFWRSVFFTPAVFLFVFFTNQTSFVRKFTSLGWVGLICAWLLAYWCRLKKLSNVSCLKTCLKFEECSNL